MRVLALSHVFPRSATDPSAPFLLVWAQALRAAGAQVVVVAPHDAGLPLRQRVGGVPVRRARYAPFGWERLAHRGRMHELAASPGGAVLTAGLLAGLAHVLRSVERVGAPDVVHVHWCVPGAVIARAAGLRAPVVVTVHGTDVALLERRPALARLARWGLARADRVEAVSADLADRLERATGRAADAVGPMPLTAVPPASPPAVGRGPYRVLGVGRLVPAKGFADLVDAVAALQRPAELTLVGDGPERGALAARAAAAGVSLVLTGALDPAELAAAYRGADVVAVPSHREGFGLVAAEALVAGVPVVATDSGGVRDILGAEGLLAIGDIPAMAAALERVAARPAMARSRAASRARVLRVLLAPETVAARTLEAYRLLASPTC